MSHLCFFLINHLVLGRRLIHSPRLSVCCGFWVLHCETLIELEKQSNVDSSEEVREELMMDVTRHLKSLLLWESLLSFSDDYEMPWQSFCHSPCIHFMLILSQSSFVGWDLCILCYSGSYEITITHLLYIWSKDLQNLKYCFIFVFIIYIWFMF